MSVGGVSLPLLFGPYELLVRLGHGGMGQVYLARRTTVTGAESLCVVKTLKPELAEDREYVGRFLDEVRTVMQLRHSSISHVFDAGKLDDTYYMAMEHLSGVTGRELWSAAQTGALDLGLALLVVEDVLGALAYAHAFKSPLSGAALSVVHRDVSPHNVIVTFEGEVKLIDFGLAESVLKQEHTESQVVMGKISYMSPEQARGEAVTGACDQFAAGVMLYELASGQRFYGARNNSEIWSVVGFGGFRPDRFDELPPELRPILDRALAADPAQRFPDCRAFQAALEALHAKSYPHATRSTLRAFMQEAFADAQRKQQQDLLRSAVVAEEIQQYTQSVSVSRPSAPSMTMDAPAGAPAPPQMTTTERVVRDAPVAASEPSESLRVPRSRGPLALVAAALVAVVGVVLVASTTGGTAHVDEPAAAALATASPTTTREEPAPAPAASDTAAPAVAPPPAELSSDEEPAEAAAPSATTEKRQATRKRPPKRIRPQRAPAADSDVVAAEDPAPARDHVDAPRSDEKEPPRKMTNAQALTIVKACQRSCASGVLALPGVKDGSVLSQPPNPLLLSCARKCERGH